MYWLELKEKSLDLKTEILLWLKKEFGKILAVVVVSVKILHKNQKNDLTFNGIRNLLIINRSILNQLNCKSNQSSIKWQNIPYLWKALTQKG
jgi:hypothetical protein